MAIFRKGKRRDNQDPPVVDTSYQSDVLAQLIVYAWTDKQFRDQLTVGDRGPRKRHAKQALAERGLYLKDPIVITEKEFNDDYSMDDDDEVVLVLPDLQRATLPPPQGQTLLETAKLLMACVPNGI